MSNERFEFLKKDYVQGFPAYCGFEVKHVEYGIFEAQLCIRSEHTQQDGFVHAGVIASMADHTGGYAAFTTVSEDFRILTIEFKINYFKPAGGGIVIIHPNWWGQPPATLKGWVDRVIRPGVAYEFIEDEKEKGCQMAC